MLSALDLSQIGANEFGGSVLTPFAVGQVSCVRLANPVGSGVDLIIIDLMTWGHAESLYYQLSSVVTDGSIAADIENLNTDLTASPIGQLTGGYDFAAADLFFRSISTVTASDLEDQLRKLTISPGKSVEVYSSDTNASLMVSVKWGERKR